MREVSVRMLHLVYDFARAGEIEPAMLVEGLRSFEPVDGKEPEWVDWDDFIEASERLERLVGGPDAFARVARAATPTAYPELRAFASVFLQPIPLFTFVMTRLMPTMYRHFEVTVARVGTNGVRWSQIIPDGYRPSETFHRISRTMTELFPLHLDMPEATVELTNLTPRSADFFALFPASPPLAERGARAISGATSVLAAQFDQAFARIAESMRSERPARHVTRATGAADWADKLALSARQRDVFSLLVEGRANKDIAATLHCSERNVEFHVGRILRAARVTSRSELLVKVLGSKV